MSGGVKSLVVLTLGCTIAAAIFGFGVKVFSWRGSYAGDLGRVKLIRVLAYVTLAIILVLKGGWWGALAALMRSSLAVR